jgi:hypothetical protein
LKRAEEIRVVGDYTEGTVGLIDAQAIVEQAETFVAAMRAEFMRENDFGVQP